MDDEENLDDLEAKQLQEQRQALTQLPAEEIIRRAHFALLRELLAKLEAGQATHQEMAILRNMLRDNGMVLGVAPADMKPGVETPRPLPSFDDDEDYEHK